MKTPAILLAAISLSALVIGLGVSVDPASVGVDPLPLQLKTVAGASQFEPSVIPLDADKALWQLKITIPEGGVEPGGMMHLRLPAQVAEPGGGDALVWCPQMPLWLRPQMRSPQGDLFVKVSGTDVEAETVSPLGHLRMLLGFWRGGRSGDLGFSIREMICAANLITVRPGDEGWPAGTAITVSFGAPDGKTWPLPAQPTHLFAAISLDVKGNGEERLLSPAPELRFVGGAPHTLRVIHPSVVRPDEAATVRVQAVDTAGWLTDVPAGGGSIRATLSDGSTLAFPCATKTYNHHQACVASIALPAGGPYRLIAEVGPLAGEGPPVLASADEAPVLWGDLHRHSVVADGWATPEEVMRRAVEDEALDFASLSEHSHPDPMDLFGILRRRLILSPEEWGLVEAATARWNTPGVFTSVVGYEWSSRHGHRNVYVPDTGDLALGEASDDALPLRAFYGPKDGPPPMSPSEFLSAHAGAEAVIIPHHSGFRNHDDSPFDWGPVEADPRQRLVEIYSEHGNSETFDGPRIFHGQSFDAPPNAIIRFFLGDSLLGPQDRAAPGDGSWVEDALAAGHRMGIIASSDTHLTPSGLLSWPGGLVAARAKYNTRRSLFDAMWRRDVYGTTGARMLLDVAVAGDAVAGDALATDPRRLPAGEAASLTLRVHGTAPLARVQLRRHRVGVGYDLAFEASQAGPHALAPGQLDLLIDVPLPPLAPSDFVYLRVEQTDGELGWLGPFWAH